MTPENIATLDRAMDEAAVRHTTEVYEGAQHGYTMSDMGAYPKPQRSDTSPRCSRSWSEHSRADSHAGGIRPFSGRFCPRVTPHSRRTQFLPASRRG